MGETKICKTIAVVSGKGGSGKTMLTATIAKVLDCSGFSVLLIDADFGTAGLTYYLGLNEVDNISIGLTNLFSTKVRTALTPEQIIVPLASYAQTDFIGVGDHRRYKKNNESDFFHDYFNVFIEEMKSSNKYDFIVVDCRGGIDQESLTVCGSSDEIIIVAETDTTSFQATQYLVDVLYDHGLSDKLSGFFVNKVFDDPSLLIRNGVVSFKTKCLSSIPFDLDAIKSFVIGKIPDLNSVYGSQICYGLVSLLNEPGLVKPAMPKLSQEQFSILSFKDKNIVLGTYILSFVLFLNIASIMFYLFTADSSAYQVIALAFMSLVLSVSLISDGVKKSTGMFLHRLLSLFGKK